MADVLKNSSCFQIFLFVPVCILLLGSPAGLIASLVGSCSSSLLSLLWVVAIAVVVVVVAVGSRCCCCGSIRTRTRTAVSPPPYKSLSHRSELELELELVHPRLYNCCRSELGLELELVHPPSRSIHAISRTELEPELELELELDQLEPPGARPAQLTPSLLTPILIPRISTNLPQYSSPFISLFRISSPLH